MSGRWAAEGSIHRRPPLRRNLACSASPTLSTPGVALPLRPCRWVLIQERRPRLGREQTCRVGPGGDRQTGAAARAARGTVMGRRRLAPCPFWSWCHDPSASTWPRRRTRAPDRPGRLAGCGDPGDNPKRAPRPRGAGFPTGGVGLEEIGRYLDVGALAVGLSGLLVGDAGKRGPRGAAAARQGGRRPSRRGSRAMTGGGVLAGPSSAGRAWCR